MILQQLSLFDQMMNAISTVLESTLNYEPHDFASEKGDFDCEPEEEEREVYRQLRASYFRDE